MKLLCTLLALLLPGAALANPSDLRLPVGLSDASDWEGPAETVDGAAAVPSGGTITYTYSDQNRVYYPGIKRDYHGDSADWSEHAGIAFEVYSESPDPTDINVVFKVDPEDEHELNPVSTAKVRVSGEGWHSVYVPWNLFDIDHGQLWGTLFAVKQLELTPQSKDGASHPIRNVFVTKGRTVSLVAERKGKSSDAGTEVVYDLQVGNTTDRHQSVELSLQTEGWESMISTVEPTLFALEPGETAVAKLTVSIPAKLPTGIRETQTVHALANGHGASEATLITHTAVRVPTPNIMFNAEGWQKIRDKADRYDWARERP